MTTITKDIKNQVPARVREGKKAEPTSAAAFAALPKLKELKSQVVVVVNTGNGMKMLGEVVKLINNRKLLKSL